MLPTARRRAFRSLVPALVLLLSSLTGAEAVTGLLENPGPGSFQSGIGVVSGWLCDAEGVTIVIDEGKPSESILETAYGTARGDTAGVCGDTNNGFGVLFNWGLLGDGEHTALAKAIVGGASADGQVAAEVVFGNATFTVTTLGAPFVRGLEARYVVSGLPDAESTIGLVWQQGSQNFRMLPPEAALSAPARAVVTSTNPTNAAAAPLGVLENPGGASFQSGIGVVSGWVCEADGVMVVIDEGEPSETILETAYGTARGDTLASCGDTNNGFGVLFNWGLLGDGEHTAVAKAIGPEGASGETAQAVGVAFSNAAFTVTTLGVPFLRGLSGGEALGSFPDAQSAVVVEWQQGSQNLVITDLQDTHFPVEAGDVAKDLGIDSYAVRADQSAEPPLEIELRTPVGGLLGTISVTFDLGTGDAVWTFVSHTGATAILRSNVEVSEDGASVLTRTDLEALGRTLTERVQAEREPSDDDLIEEQSLETPLPPGAPLPTLGEIHGIGTDLTAFLQRVSGGADVATDAQLQGWFEQAGLQDLLFDAGATFVTATFRDPNLSEALKVRLSAIAPVGEGATTALAKPAFFDDDDDPDPRDLEKQCAELFGPEKGIACCNICTIFTPDLMPLGAFYTRACACCANLTGQRQQTLSACVRRLSAPIFDDERCRREHPAKEPGFISVKDEGERWCTEKCDEDLCRAHCVSQGAAQPTAGQGYCGGTLFCNCPEPDPNALCQVRHGESYCGQFSTTSNGALISCRVAKCNDQNIQRECALHPELVEVCEHFGGSGNVGCQGQRCSEDCRSCEPCECTPGQGSGGCTGGKVCGRDCTCEPAPPCAIDPSDRASAPLGTWCSQSEGWCGHGLACDTATCRCKPRGNCGDGVCDTAAGEQEEGNPSRCTQDCPVSCGDGKCNVEAGEADPVLENYCAADCAPVQCCVDTGGCPSEEPFSCPGECCCCPAGATCHRGGIGTPWTCGF